MWHGAHSRAWIESLCNIHQVVAAHIHPCLPQHNVYSSGEEHSVTQADTDWQMESTRLHSADLSSHLVQLHWYATFSFPSLRFPVCNKEAMMRRCLMPGRKFVAHSTATL